MNNDLYLLLDNLRTSIAAQVNFLGRSLEDIAGHRRDGIVFRMEILTDMEMILTRTMNASPPDKPNSEEL